MYTYANNCKDPTVLRGSFLSSGLLAAGVTGVAVAFPEQSVPYIGYLASALVFVRARGKYVQIMDDLVVGEL